MVRQSDEGPHRLVEYELPKLSCNRCVNSAVEPLGAGSGVEAPQGC